MDINQLDWDQAEFRGLVYRLNYTQKNMSLNNDMQKLKENVVNLLIYVYEILLQILVTFILLYCLE